MISSIALAQHPGAPVHGGAAPPMRGTGRMMAPPSPRGGSPLGRTGTGSSSVTVIGANANQSFTVALPSDLLGNGVPGLGFTYPHLAAISGNLGVLAQIDPKTQAELALAERLGRFARPVGGFFPVFDSGYEYPPVTTDQPQQAPPPQVIIVQQPAAASAPVAYEAPAIAPMESSAAGSQDVGTFVLVKKDGAQVEAGAYFREGDQIVYITPKGAKRTMLYSELDRDATREINEERGTSLEL
jgi:hypothetical protein